MDNALFLAQMEDVLELSPGTLKGDESLEDFDMWDSLAVVTFIALIDEHFEVTLSPEDITRAKSVADLSGLVASQLNG